MNQKFLKSMVWIAFGVLLIITMEATTRSLRAKLYVERRGGEVYTEGDGPFRVTMLVIWRNCDVSDRELRYLANLRPNSGVDLSGNPGITDRAVDIICQLPLHFACELDVRDTGISTAGLAKLRSRFPKASINQDVRW